MFTPDAPPSSSNYVSVINQIRNELSEKELEAIRFQFQCRGRSMTSQELRDHFGYSSIGGSNLIYGNLAKKFANELPMQTEPPESQRTRYWKAISTGDGTGEHFIWTMRNQFADALMETGIVDSSMDGFIAVPDLDVHINGFSSTEGRKKLKMHLTRERNSKLVAAKKASVDSHACEVCGFDFEDNYGIDYCEAHHLKPLSELMEETETTLEDLAIVCANCHRIIHTKNPPFTLEEVREMLEG